MAAKKDQGGFLHTLVGLLIALACGVLIWVLWLGPFLGTLGPGNAPPAAKPAQKIDNEPFPRPGDRGYLYMAGGGSEVIVAKNEQASAAINKASRANDGLGFIGLVMADQAYLVEAGTPCLMLDPGLMQHEVRIMAGQHAGRSGLIPTEWYHRRTMPSTNPAR